MTTVTDQLKRPLRDLRVSITDRCNLRCQYCLPEELFGPDFAFFPREELLTFEEINSVVAAFVGLGVRKVRITGGEPLLRRDVGDLVRLLRETGPDLDLAMTTNGLMLGRHLTSLRQAGLDRLNISLDALDPEVAKKMAGRPLDTDKIWAAVVRSKAMGFRVKLNTVIKKGVNECQILPLAERCRTAGIELRFIEYMDVGSSNGWHPEEVVLAKEIQDRINRRFPLSALPGDGVGEGTARRYRYEDEQGVVGFINSISQPFCQGCNRARISATGELHTCLFANAGHPLKRWLREENLDKSGLRAKIEKVWSGRTDRYSEIRNPLASEPSSRTEMWQIGG
jgi:cyclic pyranopterin phosphate synthase